MEFELQEDEELPLPEVRWRIRRLITALRLFHGGGVACGELGWVRSEQGRWRPFPLYGTGPARGAAWLLAESEIDELRDFATHVAGWQAPGLVSWALGRFEMGCERPADAEALPDFMLALRGLLDAADDAGRASLSLRVAALCAEQSERRGLQLRMEKAVALERGLASGVPFDLAADGGGEELVAELEDHLRAVLRDIACGYLAPDLKAVADDLLLRNEPFEEIRVTDTRDVPERLARPATSSVGPAAPLRGSPGVPSGGRSVRAPQQEPEADWGPPDWTPDPEPQREAEPRYEPEPPRRPPLRRREREPEPVAFRAPVSQRESREPQPQLVVDDFAWDVDEAGDWSAPV